MERPAEYEKGHAIACPLSGLLAQTSGAFVLGKEKELWQKPKLFLLVEISGIEPLTS